MSDDSELQTSNAETEDNSVGNFVAALVAARETAQLSHAQVAAALRLEVPVVRALDVADFSALGAPVFIKGHLRAYGKLLHLPPNELVELYECIHPATDEWRTRPAQQEQVRPANLAQWGLIAVLVLAVVAVGSFLLSGSPDSDDSKTVRNAEPAPLAVPLPDAANSNDESELNAVPVDEDAAEAAGSAEALPQVIAEAGTTRVTLVFADDSWVEVADANGRLLVNVIAGGSTREFDGVPPFSFVLGNAKAVQVSFDGVPYNVPVWSVRDKAARFKLTRADIEALKDSAE